MSGRGHARNCGGLAKKIKMICSNRTDTFDSVAEAKRVFIQPANDYVEGKIDQFELEKEKNKRLKSLGVPLRGSCPRSEKEKADRAAAACATRKGKGKGKRKKKDRSSDSDGDDEGKKSGMNNKSSSSPSGNDEGDDFEKALAEAGVDADAMEDDDDEDSEDAPVAKAAVAVASSSSGTKVAKAVVAAASASNASQLEKAELEIREPLAKRVKPDTEKVDANTTAEKTAAARETPAARDHVEVAAPPSSCRSQTK